MTSRRHFLALAACWLPVSAMSQKVPFPRPQGPVLLEVAGAIQRQNSGRTAQLDLAMLDALPQTSFSTNTIWTVGALSFSGPTLMSVLTSLGATEGKITAIAANDYSITLAPGTVDNSYPILATRKNGVPFTLRQSGPIWLVYPYDSYEKYRTDLIYSQSVWQLIRLNVGAA